MKNNIKIEHISIFLYSCFVCLFVACDITHNTPNTIPILYKGPSIEMKNVIILYSDSARVKIRMKAPLQQQYENGNKIFEKGIFLEFYDKNKDIISTFESQYAEYTHETNLYKGVGNVIIINKQTNNTLHTEELFWDPYTKQVYTSKYVTITSDGEIHSGEGLVASDDFINYKITKPQGTMKIED